MDKSYDIDETSQLDTDLASFQDSKWAKSLFVDQFIAGFHAPLDQVSSLNMGAKLNGHILLRQACLPIHDRNIVLGSASGKYNVTMPTSVACNEFWVRTPFDFTLAAVNCNSTVLAISDENPARPPKDNGNSRVKTSWPRESATQPSRSNYRTQKNTLSMEQCSETNAIRISTALPCSMPRIKPAHNTVVLWSTPEHAPPSYGKPH